MSYNIDNIDNILNNFFSEFYNGFYLTYYSLYFAVLIVKVIALWKIFKKAGRNGWEALIPIYNNWVLFEICGYPGYYSLFILIPCFGSVVVFVFKIMAYINLCKRFNKQSSFVILLVLLEVVGLCILGFGNDDYDGSFNDQNNTNFNNNNNSSTEIVKEGIKKNKFCGNCGTKVELDTKVCPNCGDKLK